MTSDIAAVEAAATAYLEALYAGDADRLARLFAPQACLFARGGEGEVAVLKLADPGSPTLIQDKESKGALYVLMPMRV